MWVIFTSKLESSMEWRWQVVSGVAPTLSSLRPSPDSPRGPTLTPSLSTQVALRKSQTLGRGASQPLPEQLGLLHQMGLLPLGLPEEQDKN